MLCVDYCGGQGFLPVGLHISKGRRRRKGVPLMVLLRLLMLLEHSLSSRDDGVFGSRQRSVPLSLQCLQNNDTIRAGL